MSSITTIGPIPEVLSRTAIQHVLDASTEVIESVSTLEGAESVGPQAPQIQKFWAATALYGIEHIGSAPLLRFDFESLPRYISDDEARIVSSSKTTRTPGSAPPGLYIVGRGDAWAHNLFRVGIYLAALLDQTEEKPWHISGAHVIPFASVCEPRGSTPPEIVEAAAKTAAYYLNARGPHGITLGEVLDNFELGKPPVTWNRFAANTVERAGLLSTSEAVKLVSDLRRGRLAYPWDRSP